MQRKIKFRGWNAQEKKMFYFLEICKNACQQIQVIQRIQCVNEIMQFTGLYDKNNLTSIYEGDIIDFNGNLKGNIYENKEIYETGTDIIVEGLCTKNWSNTEKKLIKRGLKY